MDGYGRHGGATRKGLKISERLPCILKYQLNLSLLNLLNLKETFEHHIDYDLSLLFLLSIVPASDLTLILDHRRF